MIVDSNKITQAASVGNVQFGKYGCQVVAQGVLTDEQCCGKRAVSAAQIFRYRPHDDEFLGRQAGDQGGGWFDQNRAGRACKFGEDAAGNFAVKPQLASVNF